MKTNKKRLLALFCAAFMLCPLLAACGGEGNESSSASPESEAEAEIKRLIVGDAEYGLKSGINTDKAENGVYLFTTKTCPNCKIAKQFLKDEEYQVVDAEEHPELTDAYGIMQAPTLVIVNNGEVQKFVNASNIKKYVDSKR